MGTVGRSQAASPDKHDGFGKYIDLHCKIVKRVFENADRKGRGGCRNYLYIDTHAGGGKDEYGHGSPVMFLNTAYRHGMDFWAHFIEEERGNVERLWGDLPKDDNRFIVHNDDNKMVVPEILQATQKWVYGLAYMDPNGCPDVDLLHQIANAKPLLDIMVRTNANAIKRCRRAYGGASLMDVLDVPKKQWIIRGPLPNDKWQWTFLFGTNYTDWRAWKKQRFYRVDSPEGDKILQELNFTKDEIKQMQRDILEFKEKVWARSNGICEHCGMARATEMHHLRYGPDHDPDNVKHVCHECHCLIEGVDQ